MGIDRCLRVSNGRRAAFLTDTALERGWTGLPQAIMVVTRDAMPAACTKRACSCAQGTVCAISFESAAQADAHYSR